MSHSIDEQGKNLIDNCKNFNIESEDFDEKIEEKALELCKKSDPNTVNLLIDLVKYRLKSHLGILSKYIEDESINEIMVNIGTNKL